MVRPADRQALSPRDVCASQLRLLDTLTEHCEANSYRYFLYAGTLLGSVRHAGFIPWDDDIDVMMPRPDYRELCRTLGESCRGKQMTLRFAGDGSGYGMPFAKLSDDTTVLDVESKLVPEIGVNIDIFPLDGAPEGRAQRQQEMLSSALVMALNVQDKPLGRRTTVVKSLGFLAVRVIGNVVGQKRLNGWSERLATRHPFDRSETVGVMVWTSRKRFRREHFSGHTTLPFEGRQLAAPSGYDEVLRIHYGDYMTPPPVEKQTSHHRWRAYRR